MIKTKKKIWVIVCAVLLFTICIGMIAGCSNSGKTEETKYDVAIRIGCSDGSVYEFPVGTDELHVEIPYDGIERRYSVKAYNLPDHPRWSESWIKPNGETAHAVSLSIAMEHFGATKSVIEKGLYCVLVIANSCSLWNTRTMRLYITVD